MKKSDFNMERNQRFGFRKYLGIGLCSVMIGSFFIAGGQQVKADTVNDNNQNTAIVSSTSEITNTDADAPIQEIEKTAPPASSVQDDTESNEQGATVDATEAKTDKTTDEAQQAPAAIENDDTDANTQEVAEPEQPAPTENAQETKTVPEPTETPEAGPAAKKEETTAFDIKDAEKDLDPKQLSESKVRDATSDNGGYDETIWGKLDLSKWTGEENADGFYELTDYKGDLEHIIIPNEADFAKAGQIVSQVGIRSKLTRSWFTNGSPKTIAFSKTDDKTVKALGPDWSLGFSKNIYDRDGQLTKFDGNNLDVSDVTNFTHMFACNKLTDTSGVSNWKFGNRKILASGMFMINNISDLTGLKDWDTSNFTQIDHMFMENKIDNLTPLKKWNVSHVTDMNYTFGKNSLKNLSGLETWKTDSLTNLDETFLSNRSLEDISALSNWNVSKVNTMVATFQDDHNMSDLSPLTCWETGKVTRFTNMFAVTGMYGENDRGKINDLSPLKNWDTHLATSMMGMFESNQITDLSPLANWKTGKVTYMTTMFANNKLTNLNAIGNWNTSSVTEISGMFAANPVNTAVLANWDLSNVTHAGDFINAPGKLVLVVNTQDFAKMNSSSYSYYSHKMSDNVTAGDQNALTFKNGEQKEHSNMPFIYSADNNDIARKAIIDNYIEPRRTEYENNHPGMVTTPEGDLNKLEWIDLVNAIFDVGPSIQHNYYRFVDDEIKDDHGNSIQVGSNQEIEGNIGQKIDLNIVIPKNYVLNTDVNPTLPTNYTFKQDGQNDPITIHLIHDRKTETDTATITRTITTIKPDGSSSDEVQTVTFTHTQIIDLVTNEIKSDTWDAQSKTFPSRDVEQIEGYDSYVDNVKSKVVNSQTVTPTDNEIHVIITYKAQGGTPDTPDNPPDVPPEPETPPKKDEPKDEKPDTPPTPPEVPDDKVPEKVKKPKKTKKHVKTPDQNGPIKGERYNNNGPVKGQNYIGPVKATKFDGTKPEKLSTKVTPEKQSNELPQTGENNNFAIAILGLMLSGLGLLGFKKKRN